MKFIVVNGKHGQSRTVNLGRGAVSLLLCAVFGLPMMVGGLTGFMVGEQIQATEDAEAVATAKGELSRYRQEVQRIKDLSQEKMQALTIRLAQLQARLVRLDALGERMTAIAKLDSDEFDFSQPPAVGGPESALLLPSSEQGVTQPPFAQAIDQLMERMESREQQFAILEELLANRKLEGDVYLAGRPIKKGWMSSPFGKRTDPFTGKPAYHEGVDFAGKEGAEVITVASGVVTWSGKRYGYGNMVEVNHGGGYITRYAHNRDNLVKLGDVVKKGQTVALMGSSGRSTGPHVHFEVYKHGRPVDPASYIYRNHR